jgi:hypothetical protein
MTLVTRALDPFSEVVNEGRRWTPDWYSFISTINRVGTVIDLPKGVPSGERAFVTDATAATFGSAVAGGGAIAVPVYFDGSVWRVG